MNLSQIHVGQLVTVHRIGGERGFRRRLMELGLLPGTKVELHGVAPLGDPVELLVRGCSLSIRKAEAEHIEVMATEAVCAPSSVPPRLRSEMDAPGVP
jgi:ferrous iron transport protein A